MAYAIKKSNISEENKNKIRSMLSFKIEKPKSRKKRYNFYSNTQTDQTIIFYNVEEDIVHLPFIFSACLLNILPNIDIEYPKTNLNFTGKLRDIQIDVENEAWNQLEKYGTSTLGLYPGFGKTILGAKLATRAKLVTVIMVHREILTTQWKKTFSDFTNGKIWIVGEPHPPLVCDVIICMDTRWHHIPKVIRDNVGFLIIDEAHVFCTPTHVGGLLAFHPKYILAESAYLLRDDGMHNMMYSMVGTHGVFRESNNPFNVIKLITNTTPVRTKNKIGDIDWTSLVRSTLMDDRRNNIIFNIINSNLKSKILVLTSLVDHAKLIHEGLVDRNIPCDYLCSTKKSYQDAIVLTGTFHKIGTGFDQANFCPTYSGVPFNLLILVCSIKKYSMLVQNIGRCFRSNCPTVIHFVDNDSIYTSHWYKARKWYLMHNATITTCTIPISPDIPSSMSPDISPTDDISPQDEIQSQWIKSKIKQLNTFAN